MWHPDNGSLLLKFVPEGCWWPHWEKKKAPGLFLLNPSLYSVTATSGICSWRLLQPTLVLCLFLCHRFYSQWTAYVPSLIPTLTCQNNKVVYQLRDLLLNPMHKKERVNYSTQKVLFKPWYSDFTSVGSILTH